MYSPGNSVIVNLCMRFPTIAVIAGVCGAAYLVHAKVTTPPPAPAPVVMVAPAPVVVPPPVVVPVTPPAPPPPMLKCKKNHHVHNGHCVRG